MRHKNGPAVVAGKRLAKRSIIGTRVCAPRGDDGKLCAGIIAAVKTAADGSETGYSIRFDDGAVGRREYRAAELVGPGFKTLSDLRLMAGQRVYITFNGREVSGDVVVHRPDTEEVRVSIAPPGHELSGAIEVIKKLDDVRVLESRKSARLMDQDTDFARLADMSDRKRSSSSQNAIEISGSRKRRPSSSQDQDECRDEEMKDEDGGGDDDEPKEEEMTECTAALVLMSLSCSPHSPSIQGRIMRCQPESLSTSPSTSSEGAFSCRSSPSPPLSESSSSAAWSGRGLPSVVDEGIGLTDDDFEDVPKRKKSDCRTVFQCTWPGCVMITATVASIESHVRQNHLGPRREKSPLDDLTNDSIDDHEEEFYYTEVELGAASSPPTLSHRDMARPPHEDPEYQKTLIIPRGPGACPMNIPSTSGNAVNQWPFASLNGQKQIKMMYQSLGGPRFPSSPMRKVRGETKKCRKVYGMEQREKWCTQCKWKKACTRFVGSMENNAQLA